MTTSSIYSVQYTRDDLVIAAHYKLGVLADGETLDPAQLARGVQALNMTISLLRAKGMPLWARANYTFTPVSGTSSYLIGTGQTLNTPYPLKMQQAVRLDSSGTRIDMDIESSYNFNQLPTNSGGIPIKITYHPQVNVGTIRLWPTPDSTIIGTTVTLTYQRPFQYFVGSTDTADFPEEWYLPLIYKTAVVLAPEWGVPIGDRNMLMGEANGYVEEALSMGSEDASLFIQPYMQPGWGDDRRS